LRDLPNLNLEIDLLKNTLSTIIENIEVWDNSLSFLFCDCLVKIIEDLLLKIKFDNENNINNDSDRNPNNHEINNVLINLIIKFYIKFIEENETDLTSYFIRGFNDIIESLGKYKKVNLDNEIIEKASSMGSFGKKNTLRKYSLFFCTCLIRVINNH